MPRVRPRPRCAAVHWCSPGAARRRAGPRRGRRRRSCRRRCPSRRKTTRSAHAACRASWVTSRPATPSSQRSRRTRSTSSPVWLSRAPVGSSARTKRRVPDERPGDGDALLLAAGHLVGVAVGELHEVHQVEGVAGLAPGLAGAGAVELEGEGDVLGGGEARDEVVVLEDEAHPAAAQLGEVAGGEGARGCSPPMLDRARGRRVEPAGDVEQGRLARAARPHDGDELAGVDLEATRGRARSPRVSSWPWTRVTSERTTCGAVMRGVPSRWAGARPAVCWCVGARSCGVAAVAGVPGEHGSRRGRASGPRPRRRRRGSRGRAARRGRAPASRAPLGRPLRTVEGVPLEPGEVAQVTQGRGALGLDDARDVDARGGDRERELDGQLVARRARAVDGGGPPRAELGVAGVA